MATRRAVLAGMAAIACPRLTWAAAGNPAYLAAGKQGADFFLRGLSARGEALFHHPLPARGHAAAAHPERPLAVAFARRPGTFALVVDCLSGKVRDRLAPPKGRQFNGHGAFSADGALLMTSEVMAEGSSGRIGVWSVPDFRRLGEWNSGGIGPHDIKRLPDGRIVVANGGIITDPVDRSKLNLDTMRPNLTLLSPDGAVLARVELPEDFRQNSIRHLALTSDGVAFATQWEGDPAEEVPLLGLWSLTGAPTLCVAPQGSGLAMKGYAGSIAAAGDRIAITSSPGGVAMVFDMRGSHIATHRRADISGVAPGPGGFVMTDGQGAIWSCNDDGLTLIGRHPCAWDNHLVAVA